MREHLLLGDQSVSARFFSLFEIAERCWEWRGTKTRGYGTFHSIIDGKRRTLKAHRVSAVLHSGEAIPDGMEVLHSCDNPSCVNPDHLSFGTKYDNMRDAASKGRICTIGKSRITHCPSGHPLIGENVYMNRQGHRRCRECTLAQQREKYLNKHPGITPRGPRAAAIRQGQAKEGEGA